VTGVLLGIVGMHEVSDDVSGPPVRGCCRSLNRRGCW